MIIKADLYNEARSSFSTWVFTINSDSFVHSELEQMESIEVLDFLGKVSQNNFESVIKDFLNSSSTPFENYRVTK